MLDRYNSGSPSPSYHESWAHSAAYTIPPKDSDEDRYVADGPSVTLPRANFVTSPYRQTANMFHSYNQQAAYLSLSEQRIMKKYNDDFRYNVPLHERFHQQQISDIQEY